MPRPDCATLEVIRCADDDGPRFVADGRADIHLTPYEATGPTARALFADRLVGVVGAIHPLATKESLTPADFHGCDYATYSKTPREGFEHETFLAPHNAVPATITRFESVTTIIAIVGAGPRITILPQWAVPDNLSVAVRPLHPEPPAITWSLLSRARSFQGPSTAPARSSFSKSPAQVQPGGRCGGGAITRVPRCGSCELWKTHRLRRCAHLNRGPHVVPSRTTSPVVTVRSPAAQGRSWRCGPGGRGRTRG